MDPKLKQFVRRLASGLVMVAIFVWLAQRQPDDDARVLSRDSLALGTLVTFTLHLGPEQSETEARATLDAVAEDLARFETRWSVLGEGALAQINATLAAGEAAVIPEPLRPLLQRAETLRQQSGGRFDPRIGALVQRWQFHDQTRYLERPPAAEALAADVAALAAAPGLRVDQPYGPAPGVQLDTGAIAKGAAAERIADQLVAAGYRDFIVNLGGNVLAMGQRGERAWRIGIRHPRPPAGSQRMLALLPTAGREAVITSGDYERYFEFEGQRYHHLLDPRSGQPARGLQSVTVVGADAALGDAASTALFVAGADWPGVARDLGLDQVLVVLADGRLQATARLADRLMLPEGTVIERLP